MRRRRRFLDHRRVLLGDPIHLVDGGVDLLQAGRLFLGAGGDIGDDAVDLDDLRDDPSERLAGLGDQQHALIDLRGRSRDQPLDLLGRLGRTLGERAHLGGHHREAPAGVAGPRRLDPRVQREQIGLEGDFVDDADDLADLLRGRFYAGHRRHRLAHHLAALVGVDLGGRDHIARVFGALGGLLHRRRDLIERGGGLLEARGLLLGAPRQIVGGRRISRRFPSGCASTLALIAVIEFSSASSEALKSTRSRSSGANEFARDAVREIALGQLAEPLGDLPDGACSGPVTSVHEIDDFHDAAVEIEDRIVGRLDRDFLAALADALVFLSDHVRRGSVCARIPDIRRTGRRPGRRVCDDAGP